MTLGKIDVRFDNTKLFSSIAIEISSLCNRRCEFCPVAYDNRPDEYMSEELFELILQDLEDLKYAGRVELYIYNEPMRDSRLVEFVRMTRDRLPRACIMVNTNGDYIRDESDILALFDVGLNQMGINVYSSARRYEVLLDIAGRTGIAGDDSLYQNIGTHKQTLVVVPKFGITPSNIALPGVNHISNRAGNIPDFIPPLDKPLMKMCTRPFRFLNIDWKGRAMLCCNDYWVEVEIGNAFDCDLVELWNCTIMHAYRLKLQNKDRRMPVCDVCDFSGGYYPHMIYEVTFGDEIDECIKELQCNEEFASHLGDILSS